MTDWTYGSEVCVEPNILVCDWVYGEEVCAVLPSEEEDEVYPTDSRIRVTSLVHRWQPGLYQLEINLGELTAEFAIDDVIKQPKTSTTSDGVQPPAPPIPIIKRSDCNMWSVGRTTCIDVHKYICNPNEPPDEYGMFECAWYLYKPFTKECGWSW